MSTQLITIPDETAFQVFTTEGAIDPYLQMVRSEIDQFKSPGVDTKAGRDAIASFAFKVGKIKTYIEGVGKDQAAKAKAIPRVIDATRRRAFDTLEAWQKEVRAPLTEWEEAEKARIAGHEAALAAIPEAPGYGIEESAAEISERLAYLQSYPARDWQEFAAQAATALQTEIARTQELLARAKKREADAAELAELRAAQARREEQEREEAAQRAAEAERLRIAEEAARAEREKAENEARAVAEAAEAERQRIDQERQEAERRAAQAEQDRKDAEERARLAVEQAERDRIAAAEAAAAAERKRIADQQAAEAAAAAAREADLQHRGAINRAAVAAFVAGGVEEEIAKKVVTLIARREIPAITISY